jgi:uncharacterized protein (TIRG00374 family)
MKWSRLLLVVPALAAVGVVLWWRGPDWGTIAGVFTVVSWWWIVVALGLNLASVVARAVAWRSVVAQAIPETPGFAHVFSAFAVGLLANAVLPARAGELARVAVVRRRVARDRGYTATLLGTVFTHRLFDVVPALLLVVYVVLTARIPHWALTALLIAAAVAVVTLAAAVVGSRLRKPVLEELNAFRRLIAMARLGLDVFRSPLAAAVAVLFQCIGWLLQLLAVWVAMRAFEIEAPLPAAALVLLLMNVATIFPLWPGNIGLLQAAVALPLVSYGVAYTTGFAYGLGLQMLEMSVGVGIGLLFLAREGISFATLKRIPEQETAHAGDLALEEPVEPERQPARARSA